MLENGSCKKCENCGKEFYVAKYRENAKYCSYACYWESKPKSTSYKNCPICNKDFKVTEWNKDKTFCSWECLTIHRDTVRNSNNNKCKICGKSISINKSFCSRQCAGISHRGERVERTNVCDFCGKTYTKNSKDSKSRWCSLECYRSYRKSHPDEYFQDIGKLEKISKVCVICGKHYEVHPYRKDSSFCSFDCFKLWGYNRSKFEESVFTFISVHFNMCKITHNTKVSGDSFRYFPDIVVNDKIIIECYGDYWHANPTLYSEEWVNPRTKKTAKDIWDHDFNRKCDLEKEGYLFLTVWEDDWNNRHDATVEFLKKFIGDNL